MASHLAAALVQSQARSHLLELLFAQRVEASVSELARRTGLSTRAIATEVRHMRTLGLVHVEAVGSADVVRGNQAHLAARHLRALLAIPASPPADTTGDDRVRRALVHWGAPLVGRPALGGTSFEDALTRGLELARRDATVLRVLPLVVARNVAKANWSNVVQSAQRAKVKEELGCVVALTSELLGDGDLENRVAVPRDRRRRSWRFYPHVRSKYEEALAKTRSPEAALKWGFWMNMTLESFRSTFEKHRA